MPLSLIDAYRRTFGADEVLPAVANKMFATTEYRGSWRAAQVAQEALYIALPRACGDAALVAAYAMHKCRELYQHHCMHGSRLSPTQREYRNTYPTVDFRFWVMYGSWSFCPHCRSLFFNDDYFKASVYELRSTTSTSDLLSAQRRQLPYDPTEHAYGNVGDSSRWWYLPGMYQPERHCGRCTKPANLAVVPGSMMLAQMQARKAKYEAAAEQAKAGMRASLASGTLYRIPDVGQIPRIAQECLTWPRYDAGALSLYARHGESMLELTVEEQRSLQIVCLECKTKDMKKTGTSFNWKKIGLSRARYVSTRLDAQGMTARAAAAFDAAAAFAVAIALATSSE